MLHALPLTHVFGLLLLRCANEWGLTSVLVRQFEPIKVLETMEQHKIGYLPVVPTMMLYLMSHPDHAKYKTGSLYRTVSGGAALPEQVRIMFSKFFPDERTRDTGCRNPCGIATVYNIHETYRPGSAGRAVPGLTIRIVDDNNQLVAATRGWRNMPDRSEYFFRVLERCVSNERCIRGWLVPHWRRWLHGRRWIPLYHRSQKRSDHQGRRKYLPARDRGGLVPPPGGG